MNTPCPSTQYVMVCCFAVPVVDIVHESQELLNLYNELYSSRDDFDMVMVAKMNSLTNDREIFDQFFSVFPESCLVVPFEDNQRRDYISKVLELGKNYDYYYKCLFLSPEGEVLPYLTQDYKTDYYGAEVFPFTSERMNKSDMERQELVFNRASLERILRCNDSSPNFVYKINPSEEVPISRLSREVKDKHVGLYLCGGGEFLPSLLSMYEQCHEKKLEFEIVVVNMPFDGAIDPKIFQEKIDSLLKRHHVCGNLWCLPFNNFVSRRFWLTTEYYDTFYGFEDSPEYCDKLIVVGPGVKQMDIYGGCVLGSKQGIDAFPFTIDAAIDTRMKEFREITLESLFADDNILFFRGNDTEDVISIKELIGRLPKIFLCIERLHVNNSYEILSSIYNETKGAEDDGFEMVFVELVKSSDYLADEEHNKILSKMPWYVCPTNATDSTNLKDLMRLLNKWSDVIVGFGDDGRVCSIQKIEYFNPNPCRA